MRNQVSDTQRHRPPEHGPLPLGQTMPTRRFLGLFRCEAPSTREARTCARTRSRSPRKVSGFQHIRLFEFGQAVGGCFRHVRFFIRKCGGKRCCCIRLVVFFQPFSGLQSDLCIWVLQCADKMRQRGGIAGSGEFQHSICRTAESLSFSFSTSWSISANASKVSNIDIGEIFLPQQIRNGDFDGTGGAIRLAGHAVPAFVVLHVRFACLLTDAEHVEGADIDADGASFFGDALVVIDGDGNGRRGVCMGICRFPLNSLHWQVAFARAGGRMHPFRLRLCRRCKVLRLFWRCTSRRCHP